MNTPFSHFPKSITIKTRRFKERTIPKFQTCNSQHRRLHWSPICRVLHHRPNLASHSGKSFRRFRFSTERTGLRPRCCPRSDRWESSRREKRFRWFSRPIRDAEFRNISIAFSANRCRKKRDGPLRIPSENKILIRAGNMWFEKKNLKSQWWRFFTFLWHLRLVLLIAIYKYWKLISGN